MIDEAGVVLLLHEAVHKSLPMRAEVVSWDHPQRSRAAMVAAHPNPHRDDFQAAPDEPAEHTARWRVVEASGGRHRSELVMAEPAGQFVERLTADDGEHRYTSRDGDLTMSRPSPSFTFRRLLDPTWALRCNFEPVAEGEASGRPVCTVRAFDRRPGRLRSGNAKDMADERLIVVDLERGFLHSDTALIDGEPYDSLVLENVEFDIDLGDEEFRLERAAGQEVHDYSREQAQKALGVAPAVGWVPPLQLPAGGSPSDPALRVSSRRVAVDLSGPGRTVTPGSAVDLPIGHRACEP